MPSEHIVSSFDQDLDALRRLVVEMGGHAESQLNLAVQAVSRRDAALAERVRNNDGRLDEYEHEIDAAAVRLLALRSPVAADLRETVSTLKISVDLERIGDYAANVAKRVSAIVQAPPMRPVHGIPLMGRLVREAISDVMYAYAERDVEKALQVWKRDEEVDDLYNGIFRETLTYMMEDARNITASTHLLFMAKNIERIGDHATNIAETVFFIAEGRMLSDDRPKSDVTSFALVNSDTDETENQSDGEEPG
ncbi:MAG: phosphate signaling complex protein PhoU [Pseudomonadota bacterium]